MLVCQQYLTWTGIKHIPNKSPYDPEATGLVEAFMKHLGKIWHTSITDKKDPYMEINKHLRVTRATPHISTGKSPAEILFGRKYITRLPDMLKDLSNGSQSLTIPESPSGPTPASLLVPKPNLKSKSQKVSQGSLEKAEDAQDNISSYSESSKVAEPEPSLCVQTPSWES